MKEENEWIVLVKKLKDHQKSRGILNIDISKSTGIKPENITRFYSGMIVPRLDTFLKIGNAVGVKADIFLNEKECTTFIKENIIELKGDSLRK